MKAVFNAGANRDVKSILEYYTLEAGPDVAMDFHSELKALIERIKHWPESFPVIRDDFHRGLMKRFPFQVIYRLQSTVKLESLSFVTISEIRISAITDWRD